MDRIAFLSRLLNDHGCSLDASVISGLALYFDELFFWNRRINLTGALPEEELMAKHLGDTLFLHSSLPGDLKSALDIGTGAGIPGLLFKLLRPSVAMFLVDARRKRISFLKNVITRLELQGVYAEQCLVGEGHVPLRGVFHAFPQKGVELVLSQAVCSIQDFIAMALPLTAATGCMVSMKGPRCREDLNMAEACISRFGLSCEVLQGRNPLNGHERFLIILRPGRSLEV
ncbi:MAG: 16S rRNA (guanine(527)-N(7))-methyltransferase RsmG [Deltaproteobacteria bacterium]|jgi:16S rRNA (guanine527-N7)-methyltransferase|nr:16S rRNA (guanine(527)-N(7))-methyltransferase RsmG [Deltaproteobacteria bacterium]